MELLTFHVGSREFGVDVRRVQEIVAPPPITRVPGMAAAVLGLAGLRGEPTPVVDAGLRLEDRQIVPSGRTPLLVLDLQSQGRHLSIGLLVEAAGRRIDVDRLLAWSAALSTFSGADACIGFADVDDRIILVLDVDRLLAFDAIAAASRRAAGRVPAAEAAGSPSSPNPPSASPPPAPMPVPAPVGGGPGPGAVSRPAPTPPVAPVPPATPPPLVRPRETAPLRVPQPVPAPRAPSASPPRPPPAAPSAPPRFRPAAATPSDLDRERVLPVPPPPVPSAPSRAEAAPPSRPEPRERPTWSAAPSDPPAAPRPPPATGSARPLLAALAVAALLLLGALAWRGLGGSSAPAVSPSDGPSARRALPAPTAPDPSPARAESPAEAASTRAAAPDSAPVASAAPPETVPRRTAAPSPPAPPPPPVPHARAARPLPPSMVVTPATPACEIHEVRRGETLWQISAERLGSPYRWPSLFGENRDRIVDPNVIEVHDLIRIPGACRPSQGR